MKCNVFLFACFVNFNWDLIYLLSLILDYIQILCFFVFVFVISMSSSIFLVLHSRVALKREDAVAKEMMKKLADDKRMTKKEKDER